MALIIEFILTHKSLILVGLFLAIIASEGVYINMLKSDVEAAEAQVQVKQAELEVSQSAVKRLQMALDEQNAAIDKMKADADAREQSHKGEIIKAQAVAATYKQQAADIIAKVSPQNVSKCDAANALVNTEIQHAK